MTNTEKIQVREMLRGMDPDGLFDKYDLFMRDLDKAKTRAEMVEAAQALAMVKTEMIHRMRK